MRLVIYDILDGGTGRTDPLAETLLFLKPTVTVIYEADEPAIITALTRRLDCDSVIAQSQHRPMAILSRLPIHQMINLSGPDGEQPTAALLELGDEQQPFRLLAADQMADLQPLLQTINPLPHLLTLRSDQAPTNPAGYQRLPPNANTGPTCAPTDTIEYAFLSTNAEYHCQETGIETTGFTPYCSDRFPLWFDLASARS